MNESDKNNAQLPDPRVEELFQRIFFLRRRFKVAFPTNLATFKSRVIEDKLDTKTSDLIYLLGIMITRQGEPITMGEISRAIDVPMSTATRIVDWFVRNEYAMRLPDPEDRRIVRITLSEAGQEVYQAIRRIMIERLEMLMTQFTQAEREQFAYLLGKMIDILETEDWASPQADADE